MQDTIVTQPAETQGLRHDPMTIALHWISALLVVVLWTIGQTVDVFPNGAPASQGGTAVMASDG